MKTKHHLSNRQFGFSLLEMLAVVAIISIISAGILSQMDIAQQRANTEQVRLDNFQEAREFVDALFRDVNQIGYPNSRLVDLTTGASWSPVLANPATYDNRLAVGLVKIDTNELRFEANVNGDGNVQSITYKVNGSGTCNNCLQRSQLDKVYNADPLTGQTQPSWGTAINDVSNVTTIFTYFRADGTQVTTLPVDMSTGASTLASIRAIQVRITISNPNIVDLKTAQPIQTTFQGLANINNCSMVANGQSMSCQ
jgi:prepilin-type N-terminal cleavage/methylation domain-containing protein